MRDAIEQASGEKYTSIALSPLPIVFCIASHKLPGDPSLSRIFCEMVQKEGKQSIAGPKRRGRPPAYDRDAALQQATDAFWRAGFSGTSLDDLAAATGMNRPSLYAAFGDKRALYLHALDRYWQLAFAAMDEALSHDEALGEAL